ncbi:MAG TPA: DUF1992 domain-containing protein [Chthonomonadaceae bacterium]|nr:DUF1992 domain-containing protein [Chthonomonadaceae bacterium]
MSNLDFMGRIAEGKILEAMEEGKFDNLPGKGKPIVFDEDPLTPPHLRMMNRILRNANVLPEWMQVYRDIEAEQKQLVELHRKVLREHRRWGARLANSGDDAAAARQYAAWHERSRDTYYRALKGLNSAILKFTIIAPTTAKAIGTYKIDSEMAAYDADVPVLARTPAIPAAGAPSER